MTIFYRSSIIGLLILLSGCKASISIFSTETTTNLGLKVAYRKGVIFTDRYVVKDPDIIGYNPANRFTPTKDDIEKVQVIYRPLGAHGKPNNPNYRPPIVDGTRGPYFMQCVGFINLKGDRIIHINYHVNRSDSKQQQFKYEDDYMPINDRPGDWQVDFDLTIMTLRNLKINKPN
jgi:hypothetical protein